MSTTRVDRHFVLIVSQPFLSFPTLSLLVAQSSFVLTFTSVRGRSEQDLQDDGLKEPKLIVYFIVHFRKCRKNIKIIFKRVNLQPDSYLQLQSTDNN